MSPNTHEEQKVGENYMDKATQYTPQAILAAMQEFYENILNNPQLRDLKMQLTTAMITGSVLATPSMASAADPLP